MNVLFVFYFGSELRQFYYSGVIEELIKQNVKVHIATRIEPTELLDSINIPVSWIKFNEVRISPFFRLLKKVLDETHPTNFKIWKYGAVSNFRGISRVVNSILLAIAKSRWGRAFLLKVEYFIQTKSHSKAWTKTLTQHAIDKLITNVPNTNFPLLQSCRHLNIPVVLLYHTNKDVIANGRISFDYSFYGVWNKQMAESIRQVNPGIDSEKISIIGSTHFLYLFRKTKVSRDDFFLRYDLPVHSRLVTYIAAAPDVVRGELEYVLKVKEALQKIGNDFHIIVRTNPMDNTDSWTLLKDDFITVIPAQWYFNKKMNFNFPLREDLDFVNDLLELSSLCIGLPSTFVVECAIKSIPFVNICFQPRSVHFLVGRVTDYWEAPFYKNARDSNFALGVFESDKLTKVINDVLLLKKDKIAKTSLDFLHLEFEVLGEDTKSRAVNSIID